MPLVPKSPLTPLLLALAGTVAGSAQEPVLVSLKEAVAQEVQSQGFTLPRAMKVHLFARGAAPGTLHRGPYFAYGWILNAATREVVWQMEGRTTRPERGLEVADVYLDLAAGSYEVYYANPTYEGRSLLSAWSLNLDRRTLGRPEAEEERGFFAASRHRQMERWQREAGWYGLELYLPGGDPREVTRFQAPQRWPRELITLTGLGDGELRTQAFRLRRPAALHLYAQGERIGDRTFADTAWIVDARSGKRVWQLDADRARYGGGASKNQRQVETLTLPAGEYLAGVATDGSHSPADWNAAPPCDPLRYGLIVSLAEAADESAASLMEPHRPGRVVAELVRVGDHADLSVPFELKRPEAVRILALGEGDGEGEMADYGWIEDGEGRRVWTLRHEDSVPAGGAAKNRRAELRLELPKGRYTLRYRTDGSHAFGDWNARRPKEEDRYGITVYAGD